MIEYVKVKQNKECYICHSDENVKTLRVSANDSPNANTIAFCEDCAREISHVLNVPMNIDIALDGTMSCPHCKNDLILAVDIGYFYNDTFCCEFCGQALRG
mgnify:FL=1